MKTLKMMMMLVAVSIVAFACKKDDDGPAPTPVEDGIYLVGEASPFTEPALQGQFTTTKNEKDGTVRASMSEIYAPMTAGTFSLRMVAGASVSNVGGTLVKTYNGSGGDDQPKCVANYYTPGDNMTITIAEAGFYHIVYDQELNVIVVAKVDWGLRGSMNGWGFTKFDVAEGSDKNTYTMTATGVKVMGDFKMAYSTGWKLGIDDTTGAANVKVNTNFGGTVTYTGGNVVGAIGTMTLEAGGDNYTAPGMDKGTYTFELKWTKENGLTAKMTKTAPFVDPGVETYSIIGNAFKVADTTSAWDYDKDFTKPSAAVNDVYTYTISNIILLANGEFKVRQDHDWGVNFGYDNFTLAGDKANFENNNGNIKVKTEKTYNITMDYDWKNDKRTLTFTVVE